MDQTHLHLLISHLPIFGSIFGGLVLAHALWTKTNQKLQGLVISEVRSGHSEIRTGANRQINNSSETKAHD